jgi:hypothetical protein
LLRHVLDHLRVVAAMPVLIANRVQLMIELCHSPRPHFEHRGDIAAAHHVWIDHH